jgi:2-dehydropantoate 2-reductase
MEAWQKTHVAVILPITKALYCYSSNNYKLAKSYQHIKLLIQATRECFKVLNMMNVPITPRKLRFYFLPIPILAPIIMFLLNTKMAEYAMAKHTSVAREEIKALDAIFKEFIKETGVETPALDWLSNALG